MIFSPRFAIAPLRTLDQKAVMKLRLMSIAAAALFVLSCQAGDDAVAAPKRGDVPEISTLYGDYLAASYAHEIDDAEARQKYFTRAYEQSPNDTRIGRRAMVAAIEMGDMDAAVDIAEDVYDADKTESLARAVLGVNAFRKGRNDRAAKYFSGPTDDLTMTILMQLVRGWIEVDEDELVDAAERFTALGGGDYFSAFVNPAFQFFKFSFVQLRIVITFRQNEYVKFTPVY